MKKCKNNKNIRTKNSLNFKRIIIQTLIVFMIYSLMSILACTVLFTINVPKDFHYYISIAALCLAALLTGFYAGKINRKNGLLYGIIYNSAPIVLIMFVSLIINSFSFDYNLPVSAFLLIVSSAAGGILSVNSRKKRR